MSRYNISVFLVWLFTISGIAGVLLGFQDWFASKTAINLSLFGALLVWNYPLETNKKIFTAIIVVLIGIGVEMLGVTTKFPFGEYYYGENLGFKVIGVPLLIGVNWLYLSLGTASIAAHFSENKPLRIVLASAFMVAIDVLIEPGAKILGYWEFAESPVPFQNYVGWFVISLLIHFLIQTAQMQEKRPFTLHMVASSILFFTIVLMAQS